MSSIDWNGAAGDSSLAAAATDLVDDDAAAGRSGRRVRRLRGGLTLVALAGAAGLVGLACSTLASTWQHNAAGVAQATSLARGAAQSALLQSPASDARSFWLHQMLRTVELSDREIVSAVVLDAAGHPVARVDRGSLVPTASAVRTPAGGALVRSQVPGGGAVELTMAPRPVLPWTVVAEVLAALGLAAAAWVTRLRTRAPSVGPTTALVHGAGFGPGLEAKTADGPQKAGRTILLVDDDPSVRRYLGMVLTGAGYRVTSTAAPLDALQLCREGEVPDLLVSDIVLPTMSGHELASVVTRLHPRARVLLMSGYPEEEALVWPGTSFLAKPFGAEELLERVQAALNTEVEAVALQAARAT